MHCYFLSTETKIDKRQSENPTVTCDCRVGPPGIPGYPGPDGHPGLPGPKGERGDPSGQRGEKGDIGSKGEIGAFGAKGFKGNPGEPGPTGPGGEEGFSGTKGDRGDTGPVGPQGEQGDNGSNGDRGIAGPVGPTGQTGVRGAKGDKGDIGVLGAKGQEGNNGPKGDQGDVGPRGAPGPVTSGAVYTRWGRTTCPANISTQLVYAGRAGGSHFATLGGASNYLCLPNDPEYGKYTPGIQGWSTVEGVEMEGRDGPLRAFHDQNVPCAVCCTQREMTLMIPAKLTCPSDWTLEYSGFLMSSPTKTGYSDKRTMFECVDNSPEVVPGYPHNNAGAVFYHTEASCNGLLCPPYDAQKELTCVVCSK